MTRGSGFEEMRDVGSSDTSRTTRIALPVVLESQQTSEIDSFERRTDAMFDCGLGVSSARRSIRALTDEPREYTLSS
jgi:hypothetical protein